MPSSSEHWPACTHSPKPCSCTSHWLCLFNATACRSVKLFQVVDLALLR